MSDNPIADLEAKIAALRAETVEDARAQTLFEAWAAEERRYPKEPALAPLAGPEPAQLDTAVPTDDDVAWARGVVRASEAVAAVTAEREQNRAMAQGRVDAAAAALEARTAEAERTEALLRAVREAPKSLLAAQVAELGDLGPLGFEAVDNGCAPTIDGRPWDVASDGARVNADAWFRAALKRRLKLGALPLVIDNASLRGRFPTFAGPVYLLITTTDGTLEVVNG